MNYNGKNYELVKQTEEESLDGPCGGCPFFGLICTKELNDDSCVSESGNDFEMIWKEVKK